MEERQYKVAGHVFRVRMEEPWGFAPMSPEQEDVIRILAAGGEVGVIPIPADKFEDSKRNRALFSPGKRPKEAGYGHEHRPLDMSQYEPFRTGDGQPPLFTLSVRSPLPEEIAAARNSGNWETVVSVDDELPYYYGHLLDGKIIYEFFQTENICAAVLVVEPDLKEAVLYPNLEVGPTTVLLQVSTSLMILYTFNTAGKETLLLHSSVIRHAGEANLFFGVSGTGKSTHSRLWLENIPGSDLVNDDNPIVRFERRPSGEERLIVYGSPWSGKTLCFRNTEAPVRALVRLERAPVNSIRRLKGLEAYASILAASSMIRWNRNYMDLQVPTLEKVAMTVPCWTLGCTKDPGAAEVCFEALEGGEK